MINGSPLAFGEGNVKRRIKNVLNYKKPKFWIVSVAVVVVIIASVSLLTNPKTNDTPTLNGITNNNETSVDIEETTNDTTYDKVSAYMKNECKKAFSPYYELLDFQISNYQEEVVNGNIEATFSYKLISKNYDKDPDTVGYIKEAKESGNKHYQQMYDEYLQPREMNFHLKVIIDGNGITLYSNISPNGIEWEETKMTDFILSR